MQVINSVPIPFQRVILKNWDKIIFAKVNAIEHAMYSSQYGIFVNLDVDFVNNRGQWTTLFHEMGHNLDKIYRKASGKMSFINALKNDFLIFTNGYASNYNISVEEAYKELSCRL